MSFKYFNISSVFSIAFRYCRHKFFHTNFWNISKFIKTWINACIFKNPFNVFNKKLMGQNLYQKYKNSLVFLLFPSTTTKCFKNWRQIIESGKKKFWQFHFWKCVLFIKLKIFFNTWFLMYGVNRKITKMQMS